MKLKQILLKGVHEKKNRLNIENSLNFQQMMEIVGGYDYQTKSSCFFNCMEYIGKEVYDDKKYQDYNCDTYGNSYVNGHGRYKGTGNFGDYLNGPRILNDDGTINENVQQNCASLVNSYFDYAASGFVSGSNAEQLFSNGSNQGVIGYFNTGNSTHAVIITGYDSATGEYSYYDPSLSSQKENQKFSASALYGALDCNVQK